MTRDRRLPAMIPIALAASVIAAALSAAGPPSAGEFSESPKVGGQDPRDPAFVSLVPGCLLCHRAKPESFDDDLVKFDEITLWKQEDPHFHAYQNIRDESKAMSARLGYDVMTSEKCLTCHAPGYHSEDLAKNVTPEEIAEEGVTCVACHGPYASWIQKHGTGTDTDWRTFDAATKESKYGMTDLRSASRRAQVCTSCHVGNADEGKVVTHEMYAAGHPPLPSFDLATFSEGLSPHWREPSDVPFLQKASREEQIQYHYDPDELLRTKLAVFGAVESLRASMGTLASEMQNRSEGGWPDFARYDCYACHHDLKIAGWRPTRGYHGKPGRVPAPTWPFPIVDLAIEAAAPDSQQASLNSKSYDRLVEDLRDAVDATQFGDRAKVEESAQALLKWSADLSSALESKDHDSTLFDRPTSIRLLRKIVELVGEGTPDYESARQLSWAFRDIQRGLAGDSYDEAGPDEFQELADLLRLDLVHVDSPDWSVNRILNDRLEAISDYDPEAFRVAFAKVVGLIPES